MCLVVVTQVSQRPASTVRGRMESIDWGMSEKTWPFDPNEHVFMIRIRLVRTGVDEGDTVLRGTIEHLPTGDQESVSETQQVLTFIDHYIGRGAVNG